MVRLFSDKVIWKQIVLFAFLQRYVRYWSIQKWMTNYWTYQLVRISWKTNNRWGWLQGSVGYSASSRLKNRFNCTSDVPICSEAAREEVRPGYFFFNSLRWAAFLMMGRGGTTNPRSAQGSQSCSYATVLMRSTSFSRAASSQPKAWHELLSYSDDSRGSPETCPCEPDIADQIRTHDHMNTQQVLRRGDIRCRRRRRIERFPSILWGETFGHDNAYLSTDQTAKQRAVFIAVITFM